ncbi:MAG: histidine phosphatase family protein [Bacteroidota bacterium]|nr:histidine phosphatase family protein [Bacteroidota bacterium]
MKNPGSGKSHSSPSGVGGKILLLIRHAKSDWNGASLSDFDRPLNERGKRDAPVMAHRLLDKKINIDAFITSPAKRAKKTATIFANEFKRDKDEVILRQELYEAPAEIFYKVISAIDDQFNSVAIFSHNPGITDFANSLTNVRIDNIPTCGIFALKINTRHWKNFKEAGKEFWFADYPKAEHK